MAERKKTFVERIDSEMKKMIDETKREFTQGMKIDPNAITTPSITPQIVNWAKIGKEVSSKRKKKDKIAEFMDEITGLK